ncbi:sphingomyelin phosphodiesterase [Moniliophthora roreri MCA 2997]|uniref:Sphingomyelin phosphodiesterase n=1 Tax=Moniliophthora roreri (strain MCA 2997) TaxID=1381753 RepID=V2X948_MONRO|nr:sphingomyelin phosphodiesterase [Moniliophthora roreri MCA 2997]
MIHLKPFGIALLTAIVLLASELIHASLQDDILAALEQMHDCDSCRNVLVEMQKLANMGDDPFVTGFIGLCDELKLADPDVCNGTLAGSGPIIAHDLRQINVTSGKAAGGLCNALFGFCSTNMSIPFEFPLPPLPVWKPNARQNTCSRKRRKPFQVVHISDVHIDREYTLGSEANCTKPLCCRNFADQIGQPISVPAPPNGNAKCDTPVSLADSMLEAIDALNPKFLIFTGDVVEGATWLVNQTSVTRDLEGFNSQLLAKVRSPVYLALGNHDSAPVNAFARATSMTANDSQWVFDTQSLGWSVWIGDEASQQVRHHSGSYSSVVPGTNLRILSVNTQYWYKQNFWLYDSDDFQPDPNGVLSFIAEQLQLAEQASQKVWVIGHIPPGKEDTVEDQSNYYDQILQRYKDTIAGHFFGHSHRDEFRIAYSNYSNPTAENAISALSVGPALTPTSGNPAFKVYDVDPDTFGLVDMRVVFTNTSDPQFQSQPVWRQLYSAREIYGPLVNLSSSSELAPAFWHELSQVFEKNETAFQLYNTLQSRGGAVRKSENNCDSPSQGISLGKRKENDPPTLRSESESCEGFNIVSLMTLLRQSL